VTGQCDTCTITGCNECIFETDGAGGSTEYCSLCEPGTYLSTDRLDCELLVDGLLNLDLYVIPFEGHLMTPDELVA